MKKKEYFSVFFVALVIFFSSTKIFACNCKMFTSCDAYSKAKTVFIGKLEKLEKVIDAQGFMTIETYFSVERTFKGLAEKFVKVRFNICEDGDEWDFKVGESYFVYDEGEINSYCNRTHSFSKNDPDLKYAESLSEENPIYTIGGIIFTSSDDELDKTKVFINRGKKKYLIPIDKDGNFNFKVSQKGLYKVKILLPFKANVVISNGDVFYPVKVLSTSFQTSFEYDLEFKPNECGYREIQVSKIQ